MEAGAAPRMSQAEMKLVGLTAMIMTITVCSDNNTGPDVGPPDRLQIVSSNGQEEIVGSDLGEPLMVRTLDADDNPVPDVEVSWSVTGGGGSLSHDRSVTDESGEATTEWTLGTEPGENEVTAEIEGIDAVTFTALALVGPPGELEIVGGDGQEGMAESVLPDLLVVRVEDGFGNPVSDVEVAWQVTEGGGSLSPETSSTNQSGEASTEWKTGTAGAQEASAHVEGLTQVTFTAMAEAEEDVEPEPAEIQIVSGDGQTCDVATKLPDPLVVVVRDADGTPLPDIEVAWTAGAGSVDPETSVTNDSGRARTEWTLGDEPGELEATATVEGLDPVIFIATAEAEDEPEPEPSEIQIVNGNNQEAEVGTTLPDPLIVEVLDADGSALPDIEITWAVSSGAGSVDPETSVTNDSGRTRTEWTLGDEPGELEATATVEGLDPVSFTATAEREEAGPPANIEIVTGAPDSTVIDQALSDSLAVRITDAGGLPVPDVEVSWEVDSWSELVPAGLSSISPAASFTDSDGIARAEWTIGTDPHVYFAEASAEAGLSETFETLSYLPPGSKLEAASSTDQTISVDESGDSIVVRLTDGQGNPLADVVIDWDYNKAPSLEHIAGHRTTALSPIRRRLTMQSPDAQRIVERRAVRAMSLALVPTDENGEAAFVPGPFTEPGEYVVAARLEGNGEGLVVREIEFTVTVEP